MEAQISEARIDELEAKLSFAEDLIDELNRSVFRQQEQLDLMQQQIMLLHQHLQSVVQSVSTTETRNLRDELPPHY
jgi:SlyX protein